MSQLPAPGAEPDVSAVIDETPNPSLKTLHLRGLLVTIALASVGLTVLWGAIQGIFLAIQAQQLDPTNQVGALGLIIGVGAIAAMIAAPIAGALTDRTRTRVGGRIPWMIVGAVVTLILTILFSFATSITQLVVYWALMQISTNFVLTPTSTHIADRVPVLRRGVFSSVLGIAQLGGFVIGQSVGALFVGSIAIGYPIVGVILLVSVLIFALVNKQSNIGVPKPAFNVVALLKTFWVNPIAHPNFFWAFTGRFLLLIGYFPIQAFTLYLLQDYIGLGKAAAATVPVLGTATLIGTVVGTAIAGWVTDKIKATKPVILASAVILIISLAIPFLFPSVASMIAFAAISGAGYGAYIAIDYVLVTQVLPSADDAGKDLGILNITTTLPQTIGVAVGGFFVTTLGGYGALFPVGAVFIALGAVLLFFVRGVR